MVKAAGLSEAQVPRMQMQYTRIPRRKLLKAWRRKAPVQGVEALEVVLPHVEGARARRSMPPKLP